MIAPLLLSLALQAAPATAPPPTPRPAGDEAAVLATVDAVFAALKAGDGPALLRHVDADGRLTAVGKRPDGTTSARHGSFTDYAGRMKPGQGFIEQITTPMIAIDADIAMLWAPFTIVEAGKVTSCGFDHFDLVRKGGVWKVANLTFSTRTDCPAQP